MHQKSEMATMLQHINNLETENQMLIELKNKYHNEWNKAIDQNGDSLKKHAEISQDNLKCIQKVEDANIYS